MAQSHNQCTIILQQFSMITQELNYFINKMSGDITKITQACTTGKENTGKFIENAILQEPTKAQNSTAPPTSVYPRNFRANYENSSYESNWTSAWQTSNLAMSQQPENETQQTHRHYETHTFPHTYINYQHPNQNPLDFHKPVIELFRIKLN